MTDRTEQDARITLPAYIVLDVPNPMADTIRRIREKFDPPRAAMPVEITLTGSCGLGLITPGQTIRSIARRLDAAAKKHSPFFARFSAIERFEMTSIFFLSLAEEAPFRAIHLDLAKSGIAFNPTPYPYQPHCTLVLRRPIKNADAMDDITLLPVPQQEFMLARLSLYELSDPARSPHSALRYSVPLGAASAQSDRIS